MHPTVMFGVHVPVLLPSPTFCLCPPWEAAGWVSAIHGGDLNWVLALHVNWPVPTVNGHLGDEGTVCFSLSVYISNKMKINFFLKVSFEKMQD